MGVCLVACSCGQYTGLCVFGALRKVASVLAFAGLRVKFLIFYHSSIMYTNNMYYFPTYRFWRTRPTGDYIAYTLIKRDITWGKGP